MKIQNVFLHSWKIITILQTLPYEKCWFMKIIFWDIWAKAAVCDPVLSLRMVYNLWLYDGILYGLSLRWNSAKNIAGLRELAKLMSLHAVFLKYEKQICIDFDETFMKNERQGWKAIRWGQDDIIFRK